MRRFTPGALFVLSLLLLVLAIGCGARPATIAATADSTPPPVTTIAPPATVGNVGILPAPTATEPAERGTSSVVVVAVAPPPVPDYDALADAEYAAYPCSQWAGETIAAGWPHEQVPKVLRTMWRESNCRPEVRSTTSDSGLMQINDIVLRDHRFRRDWPGFVPASLFNPNVNLAVARWLWGIDGWAPWRGGA